MEDENYLKRQKFYKVVMLVILTAFLTFIFTTVYITNKYNNTREENKTISSVFGGSSKDQQLSKNIKYKKTILDKYY